MTAEEEELFPGESLILKGTVNAIGLPPRVIMPNLPGDLPPFEGESITRGVMIQVNPPLTWANSVTPPIVPPHPREIASQRSRSYTTR